MKKVLLCLLLVSCGDITRSEEDFPPTGPTETPPIEPGECVAIDWNQSCPLPPDAAVDAPADAPEMDPELKAACCHALEDGQPPKFECGYPPGICKSGRHDLHCGQLTFTLCNP